MCRLILIIPTSSAQRAALHDAGRFCFSARLDKEPKLQCTLFCAKARSIRMQASRACAASTRLDLLLDFTAMMGNAKTCMLTKSDARVATVL